MTPCQDHLDYTNDQCPQCFHEVDSYGNTENDFRYCCYPDCGCDGHRLCMAKNGASDLAFGTNIEGMWGGKTEEQLEGLFKLLGYLAGEKK